MTYEQPVLVRDTRAAIIGGVCAGIARRMGLDISMVRIAYVLVSVLSAAFPGTIVYLILWALLPDEQGNRTSGPLLIVLVLFGLPLLCAFCAAMLGVFGALLGAIAG